MTRPTTDRHVDVAAIMELIRDENRRRRDRGLLTEDEVEERARQRFRDWAEGSHIDPRLLDRFLAPGHDWNIASDYIIRTHRKGLFAQLSLVAKRLVSPLVRLYTDHVVDRQTQVNQYFHQLLQEAIRENVRLAARLAAFEDPAARKAEPGLSSVAREVRRRLRDDPPDMGTGSP